jgi:MFS family permease
MTERTMMRGGASAKPEEPIPTPLRSPLIAILWLGLTISIVGDYFYRVGLTWNVTATGDGAAHGAMLGAAMALPVAALGLFAGTIVDRHDRAALMIVTDLVRFAIVGLLAVLLLGPHPSLAIILGGAAVLAGSGVCFTPSLQAWLPDLFQDRDRLVRWDALFLSTVSAAGVVGPALAGLLLPAIGVAGLLLVDAATFAVSAVCVVLLVRRQRAGLPRLTPVTAPAKTAAKPGFLRTTADGLSYIFSNRVLRPQFSVYPFMECVTYGVAIILPSYLAATHQPHSWLYGAMLAANAAGRFSGGWLLAHTPLRRHRGRVLSTNHLIQGAALLLFVEFPSPWLGLAAFALMGLPAGAAQVALSSWVQTNIERQFRGRAFGTLGSLVLWLMPLGPVAFGSLASCWGVDAAFVAASCCFLLGGLRVLAASTVRGLK